MISLHVAFSASHANHRWGILHDWPWPIHIPRKPHWREIVKSVADRHGVSISEIIGPDKRLRFVLARHEAMFHLRRDGSRSLPAIGRLLGGRDHSTVLNGVRRHAERLAAQ
jgi:chromosomal replication initiation ATPase DnaA